MPEGLMGWCPYDPGNAGIARRIDVRTVTIHRTIGRWPGDYSVGKNRDHNSGTFQFLIGQDDGQWVQFYPVDTFCSHAAGSNESGPGIELSGQNGEPLTDWQIDALGRILRWLRDEWGIAPTFTSGDPRVWADYAPPLGFITHDHVDYPPRPSLRHYNYITHDEFVRAIAGPIPAPPPRQDDDMTILWMPNRGAFLVSGGLVLRRFTGPSGLYGISEEALAWKAAFPDSRSSVQMVIADELEFLVVDKAAKAQGI